MTAAQQPTWQKTLVKGWQSRGALAWLLWPLSLLYGVLIAMRRWLYRRGWLTTQTLPVPVVVVGNVIAGGAGKTPVVIELVQHLQRRGLQVGVISRGYGRRTQGILEVTSARAAYEVGDEPALIHRRTGAPVFVGARRVDAARALLAAHPNTHIIVSDDGLQHLALARALEIVVFDARGTGNGWLLPAGPMRERWPRQAVQALVLRTAHHPHLGGYVLTRQLADVAYHADGGVIQLAELAVATGMAPDVATNGHSQWPPHSIKHGLPGLGRASAHQARPTEVGPTNRRGIREQALFHVEAATNTSANKQMEAPKDATAQAQAQAQAQAAAQAPAKPLLALAAIAQPEAFFAMLRARGISLANTLALPDHFDFSSFQPNEYKGYQLMCTEKDAVKLWPLCPDALAVPLVCDLPEAFWQAFDQRLEPLSLPHGHTTT